MPNVTRREGATPQGAPVAGAADRAPGLEAAARLDDRSRRYRRKFTFPDESRLKPTDPKTVVLVELKTGEIDSAYEVSANKRKVASELAKLAVYKVDGKPVGLEDLEIAWPTWSNKVREHVLLGYHRIHQTSDEADDRFFASEEEDVDEASSGT